MASPPPAGDCPSPAGGAEESVDVLVPGRPHPLHLTLPHSCAHTTVGELRAAALEQLHGAPTSEAHYIRLIFRGKELRAAEATLASLGIQSGSSLHGMVTTVRPPGQSESEMSAAQRAARQVLASAVGTLLGNESEGERAAAAPDTAGARAQMSQNELMRLLHEETMLRRAAVNAPTAAAAQPRAREELVETEDGGRVRVTTLSDNAGTAGASAQQRRQAANAAEADGEAEEDQARAAQSMISQYKKLRWTILLAMLAGFLVGPVALFFPFEKIEVPFVLVGFLLNMICSLA